MNSLIYRHILKYKSSYEDNSRSRKPALSMDLI